MVQEVGMDDHNTNRKPRSPLGESIAESERDIPANCRGKTVFESLI